MKGSISIFASLIIVILLGGCTLKNEQKAREGAGTAAHLTDVQLMDSIQYYTFQYFWDGAEPHSGMARERFHVDGEYPQNDKHIITSGGSSFGIMALIVGMERGYITREAGMERMNKIMDFLDRADRFHGICPHWWNGETGKVKPFSKKDNGGDLVETSYLVQGLYTMKQYLDPQRKNESDIREKITRFIDEVEWNWHEADANVLIWHWSPDYEWQMSHEIRGYNECLITYIMAASSSTFRIRPETYHQGWARNGKIKGVHEKYGLTLDMNHNGNEEYGGPLFWAHYSYLGLDPRNLKDAYSDYWKHNVNHVMIDYLYCLENPGGFQGYGENCWGLSASYSVKGYTAHSPANDRGVISPTAALASMPYAPVQALKAARYFYEDLGDRLMGPYGFYDAFSLDADWFPQRYLAIDQGPIVVMIENYRTGLLWELFMKNTEVQDGLKLLGFNKSGK